MTYLPRGTKIGLQSNFATIKSNSIFLRELNILYVDQFGGMSDTIAAKSCFIKTRKGVIFVCRSMK